MLRFSSTREIRIAGEGLRNDADDAANGVGFLRHVEAGNHRPAAGDGDERGHHANERALAGAVGSEQAEDFAVVDGEADAFDGLESAVALDDVFNSNRYDRRPAWDSGPAVARLGSSWLHQLALGDVDIGSHAGDEALAGIVDDAV